MYRLLGPAVGRTSTVNAFLRTYTSRQTVPSLTEGEKYIFDKLTKELAPSELLVQDVSGRCRAFFLFHPHRYATSITRYLELMPGCVCVSRFRWLRFFLCHYHCEREARGAPDPQAASENQERSKGGHGWVAWTPGLSPPPTDGALSNEPLCSCL